MTGPRLSYEDFQREVDLSPEAFASTPQRRAGDKPRGFRTPEQIKRLNANDQREVEAGAEADTNVRRGKILGTLAAPLSEVPGGKALQGAVAAAAAPMGEGGYREGVESIEGAIASSPALARIPAKVLGGVAAAGAIPLGAARAVPLLAKGGALAKAGTALGRSAALQGATYGAASGLLEADPDAGVGRRLLDAGIQGTVGAAFGKGAELASTAIRGAAAKPLSTNLTARSVERANVSSPLFENFRKLGDLGRTPELDDILALPVVERAAKIVQGESPSLAKLPLTDARVLDAIYKRVGDKAFTAKHGYETAEALDALGNAIEGAAQAKGGSYRVALDAFKEGSKGINAVKRGHEATRFAASPAGTPITKATTQSPDALKNWLDDAVTGAGPAEREAVEEGILSMVQRGPTLARFGTLKASVPVPGVPSRTLRAGARLLRETGAKKPELQRLIEALSVGSTPTR